MKHVKLNCSYYMTDSVYYQDRERCSLTIYRFSIPTRTP
ncbi:hypothetical protein BN135_2524 [Cronobacter muytjensii 530]